MFYFLIIYALYCYGKRYLQLQYSLKTKIPFRVSDCKGTHIIYNTEIFSYFLTKFVSHFRFFKSGFPSLYL